MNQNALTAETMWLIGILIGISGASVGFGMSQLIIGMKLSNKVTQVITIVEGLKTADLLVASQLKQSETMTAERQRDLEVRWHEQFQQEQKRNDDRVFQVVEIVKESMRQGSAILEQTKEMITVIRLQVNKT